MSTASRLSGHISTYHKLAYGLPGVPLLPLMTMTCKTAGWPVLQHESAAMQGLPRQQASLNSGLPPQKAFPPQLGTLLLLAGFATSSLSFLISVYATDFFVSLGASLAFLSFFMALARSFDIVTDPLMAW